MEKTLVLGIGNILCGDEGIGCRIAEYLYCLREYPPDVEIADGGTMGQELLGRVMEADNLLIIDCADFGLESGQSTIKNKNVVPMWLGANKISPHQGSFAEILALAKLKNALPKNVALLGVQPETIEFGKTLSPLLRSRIGDYAKQAQKQLSDWGYASKPREKPLFLNDTPVGLQNFEPDWNWPNL